MESYTPKVVQEAGRPFVLVEVLLQLGKCVGCGRVVVPADSHIPWPSYIRINAQAQMDRAGWRKGRRVGCLDLDYVCDECQQADRVRFACCLCGEERLSSQLQESIGYPPEHLCRVCYETQPAKVWLDKLEALEDAHRYDWE